MGNLSKEEEELITKTLADLQLNYVDELKREEAKEKKKEPEKEEEKPEAPSKEEPKK